MNVQTLLGALISIAIIIGLFIIFRAVVLWYWKIDKIVSLLTEIEQNTKPKDQKEEQIKS